MHRSSGILLLVAALSVLPTAQRSLSAQSPPVTTTVAVGEAGVVSPEVSADRRVTFRVYAPRAVDVSVRGDWGLTRRFEAVGLEKDERGIWSVTIGPVPRAIAVMRYNFVVDGVAVVDQNGRAALVGNNTVQSVVVIPGSDDPSVERRVPHGAIRTVSYWSSSLGIPRRMHIYTPPGYDVRPEPFPVLYLFPGAGGDDALWSEIGRAGFVIDNLLADRKVKPMVLVMPDPRVPDQQVDLLPTTLSQDRFFDDFQNDVMPYVAKNLHVRVGSDWTGIAGASTGGAKAWLLGMNNLDKFSHIGLFSSGWYPKDLAVVESQHQVLLDAPSTKKRLKLLWVGVGTNDLSAAFPNTPFLLQMLQRHSIKYTYHETDGDHTWINWRRYLSEFAPLLFR